MFDRSMGLEQEFFLVEDPGEVSSRADEFLARRNEKTGRTGGWKSCAVSAAGTAATRPRSRTR